MHNTDLGTDAAALAAFLRSDPSHWSQVAPRLVDHVSQDRLRAIVDATRHRVGEPLTVGDSPEGLIIAGPSGRVCAWVSVDGDQINDLLISPHLSSGRSGRSAQQPQWWSRFVWPLVFATFVGLTWTSADRGSWVGQMLLVVAGYLGFEGFGAPALYPWWYRRPLEALSLIAGLSAVLWSGLPAGGIGWGALGGAAAVLMAGALLNDRRHRWGASPAQPLERLPVAGRWYVVQGGGRWLNHHFTVLNQRGAIDVVRTGAYGSRASSTRSAGSRQSRGKPGGSRELTDYLAYGQDVVSPCHGTVRAVADGLPDQVPGEIRYGPAAGNHVVIDTGSELVLLGHLRPGTVRVVPGETVRTGQLLGQVGNSGNTTEPHLHLHIERAGEGLDLSIAGLRGVLHRGRTIRS